MKYKTIFIIDPIRSDRIQLSKFIMQEFFTVMSFVSAADCFKRANQLPCDLVLSVIRTGKNEIKHLLNIKKKFKKINLLIVLSPDFPEVNLSVLQENGFTSVYKANNQEKIREITLSLLAPDGIPPRTETPHPVPIPEKYKSLLQTLEK